MPLGRGSGDRILRYLLIIFKSSNNHNYAKEAVNLLFQYHYVLSEREKGPAIVESLCKHKRD